VARRGAHTAFDAVVRGWLDHRINVLVESMNGQVQKVRRAAPGYRTFRNFNPSITCGCLFACVRASKASVSARRLRRKTFAYSQINDLEVLFLMSQQARREFRARDRI